MLASFSCTFAAMPGFFQTLLNGLRLAVEIRLAVLHAGPNDSGDQNRKVGPLPAQHSVILLDLVVDLSGLAGILTLGARCGNENEPRGQNNKREAFHAARLPRIRETI
jgi:hypothetical protein